MLLHKLLSKCLSLKSLFIRRTLDQFASSKQNIRNGQFCFKIEDIYSKTMT